MFESNSTFCIPGVRLGHALESHIGLGLVLPTQLRSLQRY
jgi:hypothetical protein